MITIKRDQALADLVEVTQTGEQKLVEAIIGAIDPFVLDDFLAGTTLGEFMHEVGYYPEDFIDKFHTQASTPISILDSEISDLLRKVKFWYEGADDPCSNCGYEIFWKNDDEAVQGVLEGKCPICHLAATREL